MATYKLNEITPFRAVHPGETIKDELKERGITQKGISAIMKIPASVVNEIINGKRNLNAEYALAFSKVLEIPAESLMNLQNIYDLDKARIEERNVKEVEAENEFNEYNKCFDVKLVFKRLDMPFSITLQSLEWIKSVLSLPSPAQMQVEAEGLFRKSTRTGIDKRKIITWKILAEYSAKQVHVSSDFNKENLSEMIEKLRVIFNENRDTINRLKDTFNEYGIIFCIEEKVDKASVDGYCFMCGCHPAIIVTKRYDRIDNLAFTVMHELGHVLMHFSSGRSSYIHLSDDDNSELIEREADEFAQESLIPDKIWRKAPKTLMSIPDIQKSYTKWAQEQGINKWIVLGRVSHETGIWRFRQDIQRSIN